MIIELFDIGTEVYYLSPKGVESGVIDYYVISKDIICVYDKADFLISDIQGLYKNYNDAYKNGKINTKNKKENKKYGFN